MHIAFVIITVFFLAPFVWLFTAAFDAQAKAYIRFPSQPTLDNFVQIFDKYAFATALGNSVFVAVSTMILTVGVVALAGYALSGTHVLQTASVSHAMLLLPAVRRAATMAPVYGPARARGLRKS